MQGNLDLVTKETFKNIAKNHGWNILAMETDVDHIHILLEYDTTKRVCDIVKELKQKFTYYLWERFQQILKHEYWKKRIFWSDGYFACSISEVSSATIQKYIESQG